MTTRQAATALGLTSHRVRLAARQGRIRRIGPNLYDAQSVQAYAVKLFHIRQARTDARLKESITGERK